MFLENSLPSRVLCFCDLLTCVTCVVLPTQVARGAKEPQQAAVQYYRQAAAVLPTSGNPYNQLAVMAYYASDELRAVRVAVLLCCGQ